jgi:hypothetical protein
MRRSSSDQTSDQPSSTDTQVTKEPNIYGGLQSPSFSHRSNRTLLPLQRSVTYWSDRQSGEAAYIEALEATVLVGSHYQEVCKIDQ